MSLAITKSAPSSATVAEERIHLIMLERTWMTPFVGGKWSNGEFFVYDILGQRWGERKTYPPVRGFLNIQEM